MAYLVTGCAGFIGSQLCERLLQQGEEVIGLDCFTDYYSPARKKRNLETIEDHPNFNFIKGDILHTNLVPILAQCDCVFHTAGQPGVRGSWGQQFDQYTKNNVLATQRLLESVRTTGEPIRVVYSSSSSIYGNTDQLPTSETALPRPYSPYGVTKLSAEQLCMLYHDNYNIPVVSLRYFTVYGPRQRPDMAFTIFIKAMLNNLPITVLGDGKQTRDFTFVQDIITANISASKLPVEGKVFNLGGGTRISLMGVIEKLESIVGVKADIDYRERNRGDVRDTYADTTQAQTYLEYDPKTSLDQGLKQQVDWQKTQTVE